MSKDISNEVDAELAKPENRGVGALVNGAGKVATFMAPTAYFGLTPSERTALETERDGLLASMPTLPKRERRRAEDRVRRIESDLRRARSADESGRRTIERQEERPEQRYGSPPAATGNAQQAVNWSALDMATQTDLIQAACRELRRAGAA